MPKPLFCNHVIEFEEVTSTNRMAGKLLEEGKPAEGTLIVAAYQTQGKGLGANVWESDPGLNLLASMILYPDFIRPENQFVLHKMASLAVLETIRSFIPSGDLRVKWPNDIYFADRKIAGILTRNVVSGEKMINTIIGVGINVNQTVFPGHLPNPVSIKTISGKTFDLKRVLSKLCDEMERYYNLLQKGNQAQTDRMYEKVMLNFGVEAGYKAGDETFRGIITGVNEYGRLRIRQGNKIREFDLKEVEYLFG